MKSLFFSLALITFVGVGAQAQTVTALATRITTSVETAGLRANSVLSGAALRAASLNSNPEMLRQIENIAEQIDVVLRDSRKDGLNGLSKDTRVKALQLGFSALAINDGKNSDVVQILNGELLRRTFTDVSGNLGAEQFQKFVTFLELYTSGKTAEEASLQATGKPLAEFANACGGSSGAPKRR